MIAHLSKDIYGQKVLHSKIKNIKVPSNWFQHLKSALNLSYKTIDKPVKFEIEQFALFPNIKGSEEVIGYTKIK